MFVEEKGKKLGYGSIIKEKNYLFYLLGQLISRFGDSIDTIAYGWMVYEVTGKTSLMALLFGINAIPTILFQPIAGVIISYKKKKNVLFICNFGRAVVVTIIALMFLLNVENLALSSESIQILNHFSYKAFALPLTFS